MSAINRRAFLARSAAGLAGALVARSTLAQMMGGGGGMGGGGMGGGGSAVVDPPVGPRLAQPPVAGVRSGNVVDVALDAAITQQFVNGSWASLFTYGGAFVAPTIQARAGDRVRLRFRNALPKDGQLTFVGHPKWITNVHVHGWHVSPGLDAASNRPSDDVHLQVSPGEGLDYEYDLSKQRPGSLGLYHPHVHGSVAEQMWGGLVGALDVQDDPITSLAPYRRFLLLLKDVTIANGAPAPHSTMGDYMHGKEGSLCTVNGQVNPLLEVRPGEVFRLRVLNVSNARFYRLALQGHGLQLVGTDGGLLDKPYAASDLLLSPGERADLLVRATTSTGSYKLQSLPYSRMGMMTSATITLLTVKVSGARTSMSLPATVNPEARRLSPSAPVAQRPRFVLTMGQGRGYVNGISFTAASAFEHMSRVGTEEIWEVVNQSGMDHPWHQHTNDGQVLSVTGGDAILQRTAALYAKAPAWKDVVVIPKNGSALLRIPVLDFTGHAMMHCHILEHEDIGMMAHWHLMGPMPM